MTTTYTIKDNASPEPFLSKDKTPQNWAEAARVVREKIKMLEGVARAFERYSAEGEPFVGESGSVT